MKREEWLEGEIRDREVRTSPPHRATTIEIEKGIPFRKEPVSANYPLADMVPGDGFAIPGIEAQAVRLAISYQHRKAKRRFKTRTQPDGTLRVWRVS